MKILRFAHLVVLAVALFAVYGISFAREDDNRTIHVIEHAITDTVVDIGPAGDSVGDVLAFANPIFDATNSRKVGTDNGHCIRTLVGEAWECFWTIFLPQGQITVEGPFFDARDSTLAITGGTGAFSTARGQMNLHARNAAGTEYDFIYQVVK
jgi:allene oxide cyclase